MQRLIFWVAGVLLITACSQAARNEGSDSTDGRTQEIVTATVEEILAQPAEYEGKQVAVSGMVTHVCRHGGQKCFVLGQDGKSQIRIVPGGDIDEFKIDLEGSTVSFLGTFRIMEGQAAGQMEDAESQMEDVQEMAISEAESSAYFIEATDFKEVTP
jgi:putative hemolysin